MSEWESETEKKSVQATWTNPLLLWVLGPTPAGGLRESMENMFQHSYPRSKEAYFRDYDLSLGEGLRTWLYWLALHGGCIYSHNQRNPSGRVSGAYYRKTLAPWRVWLSGLSICLPVWFPVRECAWVAGLAPSWRCTSSNHILMFL